MRAIEFTLNGRDYARLLIAHRPDIEAFIVIAHGVEIEKHHCPGSAQTVECVGWDQGQASNLCRGIPPVQEIEFERRVSRNGDRRYCELVRRESHARPDKGGTGSRHQHERSFEARSTSADMFLKAGRFHSPYTNDVETRGVPVGELPTIVLGLMASAFAIMGLGAILVPLKVTRQFGIGSLDVDGRNEVRAVYGGFGIMMATALVLALNTELLRPGICMAVGLALAGMAGGRLLSSLMDRGIGKLPLMYLFIETIDAEAHLYKPNDGIIWQSDPGRGNSGLQSFNGQNPNED